VETLEYVEMFYRRLEGIAMIKQLIAGPISTGIAIQALFSLLPFAIVTMLLARKVRGNALIGWMSVSSVLLMSAVLAMRWNVVIGGQELSKTAKGVLTYIPGLWGREGVVWAITLLCGSFVFLWILARLLPPWERVRMSE
jgi:predicted membrane protein